MLELGVASKMPISIRLILLAFYIGEFRRKRIRPIFCGFDQRGRMKLKSFYKLYKNRKEGCHKQYGHAPVKPAYCSGAAKNALKRCAEPKPEPDTRCANEEKQRSD